MKYAFLFVLLAAAAPGQASEKRCGWLVNPTPANWWLVDRDGEWTMSVQGGYQAQGMEDLPDMSAKGWVRTNGYYGHGCACMTVDTDKTDHRIRRIHSATPLPLKQCRADRRLPKP